MLGKFKKIPAIYAAFGVRGVISRLPVPLWARSWLSAGGNVLMRAQSLRLPRILDAIAARYVVEPVTLSNVAEVVRCSEQAEWPQLDRLFRTYLERGARGVAVRDEGTVVAYNWAFERSYDLVFTNERRLTLEIPDDGVMLGSGYIVPSHRMRGLFPLIIREGASAFGPGRRCWSSTDIWNEVSLTSHLRIGFARVATIACRTVLGATRFTYREEGAARWRSVDVAPLELARFDEQVPPRAARAARETEHVS